MEGKRSSFLLKLPGTRPWPRASQASLKVALSDGTIAHMAIKIILKEVEFGVGDRIRVHQKIKEGDKNRESIFEGMVLKIKGRNPGKTFTVRRIGEAGVGIEKIFPIELPSIEKIVVVKRVRKVLDGQSFTIQEPSRPQKLTLFLEEPALVRMKPANQKKFFGKKVRK